MNQEQIKQILDNAPEGFKYYLRYDDEVTLYAEREKTICNHVTFPPYVVITANQVDGLVNGKEWESLSDLRAQIEPEQERDGEGLPPVGVECEAFCTIREAWVKFIPRHISGDEQRSRKVIYGEWYHPKDCMWEPTIFNATDKFRKPETPEQKAARLLHGQVCEIMKGWGHEEYEYTTNRGISSIYAAVEQMLQDGYRKE